MSGKLLPGQVAPDLVILTTKDSMISMISEGLLDVDEANAIKVLWESKYRFRMNFSCFRSLPPLLGGAK